MKYKLKLKPEMIEAIEFVYSQKGIDELKEFAYGVVHGFNKDRSPFAKGVCMVGCYPATEGNYIVKYANEGNIEFMVMTKDEFMTNYEVR